MSEYPEILQHLRDTVKSALIEAGITEQTSSAAAFQASERIRKDWGGTLIYIAKGMDYELSLRDQEIWDKFNGTNHRELVVEYGVSFTRLYQIIKIQRRKLILRHQKDLFGPP